MKAFVAVLPLIVAAAAYPDKPDPYAAPAPYEPAPAYKPAPAPYKPPAPKYAPAAPKYEPAPAPKYEPAPAPKYEPAPAPKYEPAPAPKYKPAPAPVAYKPKPAPYKPPAPVAYKPAPAPYKPAYKPAYKEEELPPQPYEYQYGVSDGYTGTNYKAVETQDEKGTVVGSYSVNLPDGRIQTVSYRADGYGGFVADVSYEGEAQYPPEPEEGYGNSYKKSLGKKPGYAPPRPAYEA